MTRFNRAAGVEGTIADGDVGTLAPSLDANFMPGAAGAALTTATVRAAKFALTLLEALRFI